MYAACAGGYRREAALLRREAATAEESEGGESRFAAGWGRWRWVKDKFDQKKSCLHHWWNTANRPCYSW